MPITRKQQFDGKAAESIICSELLKRGITPFIPLLDDGVDVMIHAKNGSLFELQIKSNNATKVQDQHWFIFTGKLVVRDSLIYVLVDLVDGNIWIIPSVVVKEYGNQSKSQFDLHLKQRKKGTKEPRGILLEKYRNNWSMFTEIYQNREEQSTIAKDDIGEKLLNQLVKDSDKVQPFGSGLDNVFRLNGSMGDFYSSVSDGLENIVKDYINNPDTRVTVYHNNDIDKWVYSVLVCGTDFWLDSFDTELEALQFIKDNSLIMGD